MKIKKDFVLRQVAGSWMAVPIGAMACEMGGLIALNGTAADIWNILQDDHTEDEVVDILLMHYEAERSQIQENVHDFITELRQKGMLEE